MRTQGATSSIGGSHNCDDALIFDALLRRDPATRPRICLGGGRHQVAPAGNTLGRFSVSQSFSAAVSGKRGVVYLPIYERIEAELDALRAKEAQMERARQRLK